MINILTGANNAGKYIQKADENVMTILTGLEAVNNTDFTKKIEGMDAIKPFIRTINGLNGHTELFSNYRVWAVEDGDYSDAPTTEENYESWMYTRKGYKIKDKDFSLKLIEDAYEKNLPLSELVAQRVKGVTQWYAQEYTPNVLFEPLMTIPNATQSASYRAAPVGFLNNTPVDQFILKPGVTDLVRNHYLGIEDTATGVTFYDIENVVEKMSEYIDVSDSNIIAFATRATLAKLKSTLAYEGNQDIFARSGVPTENIAGVQFIVNSYMPKNKILFINGDSKSLITKIISPKADRVGLAIVKDSGWTSMESIKDFIGAYYKVMPEGYFVTERHNGLWLDIGNESTDQKVGGPMSDVGKAEIANHGKILKARWSRNLI